MREWRREMKRENWKDREWAKNLTVKSFCNLRIILYVEKFSL